MAEDLTLIRDLAVVLVTAGATALLFQKLRLPSVLGYLAAGALVGPHVAGAVLGQVLVVELDNISVLAQLGVLFLLFALGLHFHLGQLRRVGGLALTAGVLEVALMIGMGFVAAQLFGWGRTDALFLGAILAVSSTTIIVKVLGELGLTRAPTTQAIFGILLVEDLVAVLLIATLSSIGVAGGVTAATLGSLVLRVAIFVLATLVVGFVVVPRVVDHAAKTRADEVLVLLAVGIAFAISMAAVALELSIALGAFIAGAIVAESRASVTVERRIAPLRDVFAAVFFVSTGILLDPLQVLAHWPAILVMGAVCIVGKVAAVTFATFVAGYPPAQAIRVGLGMAMIGEFSFVIADLGREHGVTSGFLFPIAVSISALTALVTPLLIRRADKVAHVASMLTPRGVRSFATMYTSWLARARPAGRGDDAYAPAYDVGAIVRVLAYGSLLVAIASLVPFATSVADTASGGSRLVAILVYAAAVLLAVPVVVGLLRSVRRLVDAFVRVIVPPQADAAANVLRTALYVFLAVVLTVVAVAAGAAFLPHVPLLAGAALVVLVAAFFLRGALKKLDAQLEGAVDSVIKRDGPSNKRDQVLTVIRERYPWDMLAETIILPAASRGAGRRIRDLQLPQRTGASIITHERDGVQTVNPPPDLLVQPGDSLGLLGERHQVAEARRYLLAEMPATERPHGGEGVVEIEEMEIDPESPLVNLTLAGSRIRERTGSTIVGLRREGVPILNPAPVLRLLPGDAVVVLGSRAQLDAARELFGPSEPS